MRKWNLCAYIVHEGPNSDLKHHESRYLDGNFTSFTEDDGRVTLGNVKENCEQPVKKR